MTNVNDSFFDGRYKDVWRALIPPDLTSKEVAFMVPFFNLQQGSKVLDLMCGYGRHAIALAEQGIEVTAIDNLGEYIEEIKQIAREKNLAIKAVRDDVVNFTTSDRFNLVICMGNSLNFFDGTDTERILKNISAHLEPGGRLLINSWSIAEIAMRMFKEESNGEIGGVKMHSKSTIQYQPNRIETITTMSVDGIEETKTAIDYVFTILEMETMLNNAGLNLEEVYSIPGRKKFSIGEPRAYFVAVKT